MDRVLPSKEFRHAEQLRLLLQTVELSCLSNRSRTLTQHLDGYDSGDLDCNVNPSERFYNNLVAASKCVADSALVFGLALLELFVCFFGFACLTQSRFLSDVYDAGGRNREKMSTYSSVSDSSKSAVSF